jgi:hypothetical protein
VEWFARKPDHSLAGSRVSRSELPVAIEQGTKLSPMRKQSPNVKIKNQRGVPPAHPWNGLDSHNIKPISAGVEKSRLRMRFRSTAWSCLNHVSLADEAMPPWVGRGHRQARRALHRVNLLNIGPNESPREGLTGTMRDWYTSMRAVTNYELSHRDRSSPPGFLQPDEGGPAQAVIGDRRIRASQPSWLQ